MTANRSVAPSPPAPPGEIVIECDLPEPPEKVWRALTVPELLAAWLLDPPLPLTARAVPEDVPAEQPKDPARPRDTLELLDSEPLQRLQYRWHERQESALRERRRTSVLSFELTPMGTGTHLRIVHGDFREVCVLRSAARPRTTALHAAQMPALLCLRRAA